MNHLYRYTATRQPQPGFMAYAFRMFRGFVYPAVEAAPGYFAPEYFKPLSSAGQMRYNLPLTVIVGVGGIVQGQMIMQPLSQEPAAIS